MDINNRNGHQLYKGAPLVQEGTPVRRRNTHYRKVHTLPEGIPLAQGTPVRRRNTHYRKEHTLPEGTPITGRNTHYQKEHLLPEGTPLGARNTLQQETPIDESSHSQQISSKLLSVSCFKSVCAFCRFVNCNVFRKVA